MIHALAALLVLLWVGIAQAACSGSSPSLTAPTWDDVAACHTAAANGDTITVSSGSYTVTGTTTLTKFVVLTASGSVTITDNVAVPDSNSLLDITESTAGNTKISGFTFVQGTASHHGPHGVMKLTAAANGQAVLITNNTYTNTQNGGDFIIWGSNQGVIWGNTHTGYPSGASCLNNSGFVRHKYIADATSWTRASNFGTNDTTGLKNLYIETNTLNRVGEGVDVDDNARTVFRYNTSSNHGIESHGTDTSGIYGGRSFEVYNNTFTIDDSPIAACSNSTENRNGFVVLRGGTTLVHDNVIPDPSSAEWGAKSAVAFFLENLRRNSGGFPCWDTITAPGSSYPAPHQVGWGYTTGGTTVTGSSCANCPVVQDIEAIYLWSNTGTGNYGSPSLIDYNCASGDACPNCNTCPVVTTYLQSGREYFTATPKPSYTAYTYPHPLVSGATPASTTKIIGGGVKLGGGITF